jgi:lysophospholipase L1-like esterase
MRPLTCILSAIVVLAAGSAAAQHTGAEGKPLGDYTLHEFTAKWMMQHDDLAELGRYRDANAQLAASADARPRVILFGDSITYHWPLADLPTPKALHLVNRGVPGQNTTQLLLRFEDDVVALKPAAVVIMGGTNDIRAFVGSPSEAGRRALDRVRRNVTAMADIADARRIKVVLCALTPLGAGARGDRDPAAVLAINRWLREFASQRGYGFVDYHGAVVDGAGVLPEPLTKDGLHPNAEAYGLMWLRLENALRNLRIAR